MDQSNLTKRFPQHCYSNVNNQKAVVGKIQILCQELDLKSDQNPQIFQDFKSNANLFQILYCTKFSLLSFTFEKKEHHFCNFVAS